MTEAQKKAYRQRALLIINTFFLKEGLLIGLDQLEAFIKADDEAKIIAEIQRLEEFVRDF